MNKLSAALALGLVALSASLVSAHDDDRKLLDRIGPYEGPGWTQAQRGVDPGFASNGIQLESWLTLDEISGGSDGSDIWGYVSPSGREYALMGHFVGTTIVEVTDPANPVIVDMISGPPNIWRDIKVYQQHAYIVSEGGDGVQVIDLGGIDLGTVTLVENANDSGTTATHNVAINEESGFLYRCGGSSNGLRIYDLADPADPQFVAMWPDRYVHDAQIVTMQTGPFAGREIAFCCSGFNGGQTETGLDIVDVTDKSNLVNLGRIVYPQGEYSHQCWLSADEQYIYLNDELEEQRRGGFSRTVVIDVSDLTNPLYVDRFENGSRAITHNNYLRDGFMFAANYQSGLRIFELSDPAAGTEVAFFDTFPGGDSPSFNGLWSVFPYFPSGTVIGSDIERGLFVWSLDISPVEFEFPQGLPEFVQDSNQSIEFDVTSVFGAEIDPSTLVLNYRVEGESAFQTSPAFNFAPSTTFTASFGELPCDATAEYYFSGQTLDGTGVTSPSNAPADVYTAIVANNEDRTFEDNAETDTGWIVGAPTDTATTGIWERIDPIGTDAQPEDDASDTGTLAWITGQQPVGGTIGDNDVDGGATTLISPRLDAVSTPGVAFLSYKRWYSNDQGGNPMADTFFVDISNDDGENWVNLELFNANPFGWVERTWRVSDFILPTQNIRVRFIASDFGDGSIVEAGVDDVVVSFFNCATELCAGDCDGSGTVDFGDLVAMLFEFGADTPPCDADSSGTVDFGDLVAALFVFGPCE